MKHYNVLNSTTYTPPSPGTEIWLPEAASPWYIMVVAIATGMRGKWKAYIGFANKETQEDGEQQVASNGVKISKEVACAHFPELPPEGFVY